MVGDIYMVFSDDQFLQIGFFPITDISVYMNKNEKKETK